MLVSGRVVLHVLPTTLQMPKCLPDLSRCLLTRRSAKALCDMEQKSRTQGWIVFLLFQGAKWQFFGGWFVRTDDFGTRHFCVGRFFLIQKELELVTCWNTNQGFLKIRNFHALWLLIFARICLVGKSQEKMPISQQHAHVQLIVLSSFLWSWQTRKPEQNACSKKENSAGWKFSLGF